MTSQPLRRYYAILSGKDKANYLLCPHIEDKIKTAKEILKDCHLCERKCGVNRLGGERGYCGVLESKIASDFIHIGEEPPLIPSYTIFFSGCTFKCVYCQNYNISYYPTRGIYIKPEIMAEKIERQIARNVNWVGGDPTPNLPYILEILSHLRRNIPQIWNSNMYLTEESMQLLNGVVDIYLTDFKYGNDKCAERLSNVKNYVDIVKRNHLIANKQCEMIVRHLVLPNHLECCTVPILGWISKNLSNVYVNIMGQYRPEYRASEYLDINRKLHYEEFRYAVEYGRELNLNLIE